MKPSASVKNGPSVLILRPFRFDVLEADPAKVTLGAKMKTLFFTTLICLFYSAAHATEKKVIRYEGVAKIISLTTGVEQSQPLLLTKTLDPQSGYLVEIACVKEANGQTRLSAVYMKVDGDNLTISDSLGAPKYLSGTGKVVGENWNWNFLKFSMNAGPVHIEDVNFVVPGKLIARKQIFLAATGLPIQLWETEMNEISEERFQSASQAMNCPEQ